MVRRDGSLPTFRAFELGLRPVEDLWAQGEFRAGRDQLRHRWNRSVPERTRRRRVRRPVRTSLVLVRTDMGAGCAVRTVGRLIRSLPGITMGRPLPVPRLEDRGTVEHRRISTLDFRPGVAGVLRLGTKGDRKS